MKFKSLVSLVILVAIAGSAMAAMDDKLFSLAYTPNATVNSAAVIRGELRGIYVDTQANNGTINGTLSVVSQGVTIFSLAAIAADGYYRPMLLGQDSAGATINNDTSGVTTNRVYVVPPLAGAVTVQWVDGGSASNGTVNVRLIFAK